MPLIKKDAYLPYIHAGDLQYCYSLQQPIETRTPTGATLEIWEELDAAVWCEKIPMRGTQMFYAQSFAPGTTDILRTRFRTDMEAGFRLIDAHSIFTIMHPPIDIDGANSVLLLYVRQLRTATLNAAY